MAISDSPSRLLNLSRSGPSAICDHRFGKLPEILAKVMFAHALCALSSLHSLPETQRLCVEMAV